MKNNAFKLQLFQMVIVNRELKKMEKKWIIYTSLKGPLKTQGRLPLSGISEFSGCLAVISITLLFRKKMFPIT